MKIMDWLIALFFVAIGLTCLTVSASYFTTDFLSSGLRMFKSSCIWMVIIIVVIYFSYRFIQLKQQKGKKK